MYREVNIPVDRYNPYRSDPSKRDYDVKDYKAPVRSTKEQKFKQWESIFKKGALPN